MGGWGRNTHYILMMFHNKKKKDENVPTQKADYIGGIVQKRLSLYTIDKD